MFRGILIAFVVLATALSVDAVEIRISDLTQGEALDQASPLQNEIFDRESHDRVFSRVELHDVTSHVNYVPVGSTFTWRYYQDRVYGGGTANGLLGEYSVQYQGSVGNCPWHWSDGSCGLLLKVWSSISRCIPEGRYRVEVLLDDTVLGERFFYPSRFRPVIDAVDIDGNPAMPRLPAGRGQSAVKATPLTSRVRIAGIAGPDGACKTVDMNWMPGTVVRIGNTIVPGSGGHRHFVDAGEIGSGEYLAVNPGDVLNPQTPLTQNTLIEGRVDADTGIYQATYLPGKLGVSEKITYQARREATERFAELFSPAQSRTVDIRVPQLVEMPQGPADSNGFYFQPRDECAHSPAARFVSGEMLDLLVELDRRYRRRFGHRLAFGGASLPFGGAIDNGGINGGAGGRQSLCRSGHDRGRDIDLHAFDEAGDDLRNTTYRVNGVTVPRLYYLLSKARKINPAIQNMPTGDSIHLRLKSVRE